MNFLRCRLIPLEVTVFVILNYLTFINFSTAIVRYSEVRMSMTPLNAGSENVSVNKFSKDKHNFHVPFIGCKAIW
jgi:hypothetical protein